MSGILKILTLPAALMLCNYSVGQVLKRIHLDVEGGIGLSIIQNTFKTYESTINLISVEQYKTKKYKYPTVRLRAFIYKEINKEANLGIVTGLNIHYLEKNPYGNYYNEITIPLQLCFGYLFLHLNKGLTFGTNGRLGYNFKNYNFDPYAEKGGLILSFGCSLNKVTNRRKPIFYELGCELQSDRFYFTNKYVSYQTTAETFESNVQRSSIYIMAGFEF
jgi:hypothetical protein